MMMMIMVVVVVIEDWRTQTQSDTLVCTVKCKVFNDLVDLSCWGDNKNT